MSRKKSNIIRFRIYPEKQTLYFGVRVYRYFHDMNRDIRRSSNAKGSSLGACTGYTLHRKGRLMPILGEIFLCKKYFTPEVIVHELAHAAIFWAERIKISPVGEEQLTSTVGPHNERFCSAIGNMAQQVAKKIQDGRKRLKC